MLAGRSPLIQRIHFLAYENPGNTCGGKSMKLSVVWYQPARRRNLSRCTGGTAPLLDGAVFLLRRSSLILFLLPVVLHQRVVKYRAESKIEQYATKNIHSFSLSGPRLRVPLPAVLASLLILLVSTGLCIRRARGRPMCPTPPANSSLLTDESRATLKNCW